jgi:hypothetical protein
MREEELRQVLLVKAVEEADREGVLVPVADRIAASRDAKRKIVDSGTRSAEDALLAARAQLLYRRITARHPFVDTVLAVVAGPAWLRWLLVAAALVAGFALSALDGTRRINILSFPLAGLVLWNLVVYVVLAIAATRKADPARARGRWLPALIARAGIAQASRMAARSRAFDAALSEALARFVQEWFAAAKPLLVLRATRALHLCAAAVGLGLVAGLYLRGIAFDYRAGWDSTFLGPIQVRALLSIFYQPALTLTGIVLPDAAYLETMRWRHGEGENAARWIHLLAATAAVWVVLPRLLLALAASVAITRWSVRLPAPVDLTGYRRRLFGISGSGGRNLMRVVPYGYEPTPIALTRLRTLVAGEEGGELVLTVQPVVRYGDEEAFVMSLRTREDPAPDTLVLLTSLAATPEDENHGALIAEVRDWLAAASPHTQLLVVVDEGPYAGRMSATGGAPARVDERRNLWREFITARGVQPCLADLSR